MAQPAWDDMQSVSRSCDGMSTLSTSSPSAIRHRCFTVPSVERSTRAAAGAVSVKDSVSRRRVSTDRSVISSNDRASSRWSHAMV
jgi:hypothetical protein